MTMETMPRRLTALRLLSPFAARLGQVGVLAAALFCLGCTPPSKNSTSTPGPVADSNQGEGPEAPPAGSETTESEGASAFLRICTAADKSSADYRTVKVLTLYQETCQMTYDRIKRSTKLRLYNKNISSLAALKDFDHLEKLFINRNQVTDLSPIAGFKKLQTLLAWDNQISSIDAVKNLTGLKNLQLQGNAIADLSPIAELKQLEYLSLSENTPDDFSALKALQKLHFLALNSMAIDSLDFLNGLKAVKDLYLKDNAITDITPLKNLRALELVLLDNNEIKDFSVLKTLPRLKYISTKGNPGGTINRKAKTALSH